MNDSPHYNASLDELEKLLIRQLSLIESGLLDSALDIVDDVQRLVKQCAAETTEHCDEVKAKNIKTLYAKVMLSLEDSRNVIRQQLNKVSDGKNKISIYRHHL